MRVSAKCIIKKALLMSLFIQQLLLLLLLQPVEMDDHTYTPTMCKWILL